MDTHDNRHDTRNYLLKKWSHIAIKIQHRCKEKPFDSIHSPSAPSFALYALVQKKSSTFVLYYFPPSVWQYSSWGFFFHEENLCALMVTSSLTIFLVYFTPYKRVCSLTHPMTNALHGSNLCEILTITTLTHGQQPGEIHVQPNICLYQPYEIRTHVNILIIVHTEWCALSKCVDMPWIFQGECECVCVIKGP